MTMTIEAVFDGQVLRPDRLLGLKPNTRVTLVITSADSSEGDESFLDAAMSLRLDGPPDWSENLDRYLSESRLSSNG